MRYLLALLLALVNCSTSPSGCGEDGAPACAAEARAGAVVDGFYLESMLWTDGGLIHTTWEPGDLIKGVRGNPVYGEALPWVRSDGTVCDVRLAIRSGVISATSFAHERLHCALAFSGVELGDPDHTSEAWMLVPLANGRLAAEGL